MFNENQDCQIVQQNIKADKQKIQKNMLVVRSNLFKNASVAKNIFP